MRYGQVFSPGGGITRASQKNVIGATIFEMNSKKLVAGWILLQMNEFAVVDFVFKDLLEDLQ